MAEPKDHVPSLEETTESVYEFSENSKAKQIKQQKHQATKYHHNTAVTQEKHSGLPGLRCRS